MATKEEVEKALKERGYRYNSERNCWDKRGARLAITDETVRKNPEAAMKYLLQEDGSSHRISK